MTSAWEKERRKKKMERVEEEERMKEEEEEKEDPSPHKMLLSFLPTSRCPTHRC